MNERNAGRKPLPYKTKVIRVPVHLEDKIRELVKRELEGFKGGKK